MPSPEDPEALFDRLLERLRAGDEVDVEELVAQQPEHAAALRDLWQRHVDAAAVVEGVLPKFEAKGSFFGRKRTVPPVTPTFAPGRVIGDFRLVGLIGQGGMGQVWEAEQISLHRRVALKTVRPDLVTRRTLDLFAREARAAGRLSHAGIVSVYGHGESDGIAWMALELVPGSWTLRDSLEDAAKAAELPSGYYRDVARFVEKLATALQSAHAAGVIHRDLKPRNILVTADDEPKVTDFGLARITDEMALTKTGELAGTYFYMSPEQVQGRRIALDHRSDVFSTGVVLYEMLALRRPFEGDTAAQVSHRILQEDPPDLCAHRSRIPGDLAVIAGKCLEKDRERRYLSMDELAADLRRYLSNEPIVARPPGRLRKVQLWSRRNPTKTATGAVAAAAFLTVSLLLWENVNVNHDLTEQTEAAQAAALEEKARADEVLRLSALQDYDELIARVDDLWPVDERSIPAYDEWLADARELVAELEVHRAKRDELRAAARAQTDEERESDRSAHPDHPRLAECDAKRVALVARRDGVDVDLPNLEWDALPSDPVALSMLVWPMVDPDRTAFGREAEGAAIAQRAWDLARDDGEDVVRARVSHVLGWSMLAIGRDDEATDASRMAVTVAPDEHREAYREAFERLEAEVEEARSEAGLARAEKEVARLEAERAELEGELDVRRTWQFPDTDDGRRDKWWHDNLSLLITALEELEDPHTGLLSERSDAVSPAHGWSIPRRLAFARRLQDGLTAGGEWDRLWADAIAAIRVHPKYAGLELTRQAGLVPIGQDPGTGLWEFWHVATGEMPQRSDDRSLRLEEDAGLVLVLIPGGRYMMGAQSTDPDAPNYDARALEEEGPVHLVTLSPFFLSKYEMTQGQWERFTGRNPSFYDPSNELTPSLLHPVEQVTWVECSHQLGRMGLELPTEAQWEFGCRAGTDTPWWTGTERESLRTLNAINLADQSAANAGAPWAEIQDWPELDDGYVVHAPIGTFAANGLGLHEVHGNVWEWVRDQYIKYPWGPETDPMPVRDAPGSYVMRGGGFGNQCSVSRSAARNSLSPDQASFDMGVRPARAIRL